MDVPNSPSSVIITHQGSDSTSLWSSLNVITLIIKTPLKKTTVQHTSEWIHRNQDGPRGRVGLLHDGGRLNEGQRDHRGRHHRVLLLLQWLLVLQGRRWGRHRHRDELVPLGAGGDLAGDGRRHRHLDHLVPRLGRRLGRRRRRLKHSLVMSRSLNPHGEVGVGKFLRDDVGLKGYSNSDSNSSGGNDLQCNTCTIRRQLANLTRFCSHLGEILLYNCPTLTEWAWQWSNSMVSVFSGGCNQLLQSLG